MSFKRAAGVFQFKQPKTKIQKLDITIASSQSHNNPSAAAAAAASTSTRFTKSIAWDRKFPKEPQSQLDIWDDDNDDLILLASQNAENMVFNEQALVGALTIKNDVSYTGFSRDQAMQSSTQKTSVDLLQDFLESDDDDVLTQMDVFEGICKSAQKTVVVLADVHNRPIDKIPIDPKSSTSRTGAPLVAVGSSISFRRALSPPSRKDGPNENVENARKVARDIQMGYMTTNLEQVKRQNDYFQEELEKVNAKYQTKEGEASMLRYELQRKSKTIDELRREKQDSILKIKGDFWGKQREMEKLIEDLQSKLDFKNMEILKIKSRKTNESLSTSTTTIKAQKNNQVQLKCSRLMCGVRVANLCFGENKSLDIDYRIFENSTLVEPKSYELFCLNLKDSRYVINVRILQNCLSQLITLTHINPEQGHHLHEKITEALAKISVDIESYSKKFDCSSYTDRMLQLQTNEECESTDDAVSSDNYSNLSPCQESKLFNNEIGCPIRRAILCISYIYHTLPKLNGLLMRTTQVDDRVTWQSCFVSLTKCLNGIAFSNEVDRHQGIVEATCTLLSVLSFNGIATCCDQKVLLNLFHSAVLCRPNKRSLLKLSEFLHNASKNVEQNSTLLEELCKHCDNFIHRFTRTIRYSLETCPLQIYAILLQIEFNHMNGTANIDRTEMKHSIGVLLANETTLHNVFMSCAHYLCVHWAAPRMLEAMEPKSFERINDVSLLSQLEVAFLYDCLIVNFEEKILQIGGAAIKNKIQVLYDWLQQYHPMFSWTLSHVNALNSIDLRRIDLIEPLRNGDSQRSNEVEPNDESICDIPLLDNEF